MILQKRHDMPGHDSALAIAPGTPTACHGYDSCLPARRNGPQRAEHVAVQARWTMAVRGRMSCRSCLTSISSRSGVRGNGAFDGVKLADTELEDEQPALA